MAFNIQKFNNCQCEECDTMFSSTNGLSRHITRGHKISLLQYFLKHGGDLEFCECGRENIWLFAKMKFSNSCSISCSMKRTRKISKWDSDYRSNISKAMKLVWASRTPEEIKRICFGSGEFKPLHSDDWVVADRVFVNLSKVFNLHGC